MLEPVANEAEPAEPSLPPQMLGNGSFAVDVVGESHYQSALWSVAGPATTESRFERVTAVLSLQDDNPHDDMAVDVMVSGVRVGHLSRADARKFRLRVERFGLEGRRFQVPTALTGGWRRGWFDRGHIGVQIDLVFTDLPRRK